MGYNDIDKKLLEELIKDGRSSYVDLAKKVGLSRVAVKDRIQNLIDRGVIENFTVVIRSKDEDLKSLFSLFLRLSTGLGRTLFTPWSASIVSYGHVVLVLLCAPQRTASDGNPKPWFWGSSRQLLSYVTLGKALNGPWHMVGA